MSFARFDNVEQLKQFCAEFDEQHGCHTYFTELLLKDIRRIVKGHYEYNYIKRVVGHTFRNSKTVYSNDSTLNRSYIGKLNSFYLMTMDLREGKRFYSPMSMSCLPDGSKVLHPGSTRLLYSNIYEHPVQVMVTDYSNRYLMFGDCDFVWNPDIQMLHYGHSQDPNDPYIGKSFRQQNIYFKEIVDHRLDQDRYSFHNPVTVDPPRCFELRKNCVYINGERILKLIGKNWTLI